MIQWNITLAYVSYQGPPEEVCKNLHEQAATWIPIFPKKNFETLNQINTCLLSSVTLEQEIQHCFLLELNCAKYLHRLSGLQNFQTRSLVRGFGSSALNRRYDTSPVCSNDIVSAGEHLEICKPKLPVCNIIHCSKFSLVTSFCEVFLPNIWHSEENVILLVLVDVVSCSFNTDWVSFSLETPKSPSSEVVGSCHDMHIKCCVFQCIS